MPHEIERKFLVRTKLLPALGTGVPMVQGYLAKGPSVRVRLTESVRPEAWLTVKGKGRVSRPEFEYSIPPEDARALLGMARYQLSKVRYHVLFGGHVWEVDRFTGQHDGFWLAEIELTREDESFEHPPWVGDEVSFDPRYTNQSLAEAGRAP